MEEILSKSTFGLRRAGIATLAVTLSMGGACFLAAPAQANWADENGEIGIVDTSADSGTQGAKLVFPGVSGQDLADVRLLIPNNFKNGDTIDLTIFDRTATATDPGQINADAAHKLGFGNVPTVTVDQTPYKGTTSIGSSSDAAGNTENKPEADTSATKATTPPVFTASLVQSSRANGLANDIIRLRVNGVQAAGNPTNEWVVTLSDVVADLGPAVSPGELRVVPFAYNGAPSTTSSNFSELFAGNVPDQDGDPATFNPKIDIYTVPAYVSPVNFNVGAPNNILADGTAQKIGDVTVSETNGYSLQNGTYKFSVTGADIANANDGSVKVTVTGGGTNEQATAVDVDQATDTVSFTLANADDAKKSTVTISGLLLKDSTKGPISYHLSGGSIDDFITTAGESPAIPDETNPVVASDVDFSSPEGDVNQKDIEAPEFKVDALSTALPYRIGGADRYETAAKIALNNGHNDYVVLASGENFPDALSSGYLANQVGGGSILLTKRDSLPSATASAMRELGTRTVFVVGGDAAVSQKVVNQLKNTPQYYPGGHETIGQGKLHVVRLAGKDRYETNQKVNAYAAAMSEDANPVGRTHIEFGQASKLTALVATGEKFADALAAGPATTGVWDTDGEVYGNLPLILTRSGELSPAAKEQMKSFGIEQAVVVGGESAVSTATQNAIEAAGADVYRIQGADRYATAAAVADWVTADSTPKAGVAGGLGFDEFDESSARSYLATGEKYADALAGAPLAGGSGSPLLLTRSDSLSAPTQTWLQLHADTYSDVVALGLGGAVSNATLKAANEAVSAK
jgi:putative cell wall-binding protein